MNSADPGDVEVIRGLLTGLRREVARETGIAASKAVCGHVAWYIANGGFGLSYCQIGAAAGVTKQSVAEAIARIADRCDDRAFERQVLAVAGIFEVTL
jgi:type IV secretory pathway TrbD component